MTPEMQILSVVLWIFLLKFIQMSVWPLLKGTTGKFSYGISYPTSLLIFALISWYLALMGFSIYLSLFVFAALFICFAYRGEYTKEKIIPHMEWDLAFFLLFFFMLEVRYLNPSISYAEKFMDHAFLASVMNSPVIPPVDPWYAGGSLDVYYYLGHWIFGAMGVIAGIKSTVVFNLVLPTVFANAGISLYASGKLLLKRYQWLPVLTLFLVNPSFIWHLLSGDNIQTVMWESTRTIDAAITEFPLFSMLWGDPHAHVIALFNQAFFLFLLIYAYLKWNESDEKSRWILAVLLSVSLGSMPLLNTWDVLIYAPVLLVTGLLIFYKNRDSEFIKTLPLRILLFVPVLSVLIYLPYYLMLNTGGIEGIAIVHTPTEPLAFLLVYGFFLLVLYSECLKDIVKKPYLIIFAIPLILLGYIGAALCIIPVAALIARKRLFPEEILAAFGLLIIVFTETIYLKDNMGEAYFRMNTVFKFSLIAWIMLGISSTIFIGKYLENKIPPVSENQKMTGKKKTVVAILLCALFLTPVILPDLNYGYGGKTLDGMDWMKTQHPYDYSAIEYLRESGGDIRIVEAEDGDYTYYSRVSSLTGYPTIIGMPFHEQMWRGDEAFAGERMSDIRKIYENPDECTDLMKKYDMTHIFSGESEQIKYDIKLPYDLLTVVYQNDGAVIYALK